MSDDEPGVEMTQERAERLTKVNKITKKQPPAADSVKSMLQDIDLKDVSIVALLATAGIGGYILGRWPNTQPLPDIVQAYLWFGLALGVAVSTGFIVATKAATEENE